MRHGPVPLAPRCALVSRRALLGSMAFVLIGLPYHSVAAGTVRRLTVVRRSTGEFGHAVPFWRNGAPDPQGIAKLNWLMRDVRATAVSPIDLRVYYLLAALQAEFGGRSIIITSGYRTKSTNDELRRQGIDAARNSFHLRGRAVDIQIDGVPLHHMAALGSRLGLGGVGIYDSFVHLDTGPLRIWRG
jgi:uncharacterized protein YcbK (DUF882 family)